ncbi:MAG: hypothetical protein C4317_07265 [Acidimicrobiia bacterium]
MVSQAGKNKHEDIMESLELFGRKVLPEFKERDEKLQVEKAKRLGPMIEKVMSRKRPDDHPPLPSEDYSFPAIPRAMLERSGSDAFFEFLERMAEKTATGRILDASDLGIP